MSKTFLTRKDIIRGAVALVLCVVCGFLLVNFCTPTAPEASNEGFIPGTYTASAQGISSDVVVTLTFSADGITEVTVDVSGETAGIGAEIGDQMVQSIMDAQSDNVDVVSGATISSNAVKAAVADCMAQASASAPATSGMSFTPGTYTASAQGISSEIVVTLTFSADSITDATVDVSGETAGIGAEIGDQMAQSVISAQSCNVDVVSGATVSSNAVKTAVADCMSQASGETVTVA